VARPRAPAAKPAASPVVGRSGDRGGPKRGASGAARTGDGYDALGWVRERAQQREAGHGGRGRA
jgi:hypothetical protein